MRVSRSQHAVRARKAGNVAQFVCAHGRHLIPFPLNWRSFSCMGLTARVLPGGKSNGPARRRGAGHPSSGRYAHVFYCFWPQSQTKWVREATPLQILIPNVKLFYIKWGRGGPLEIVNIQYSLYWLTICQTFCWTIFSASVCKYLHNSMHGNYRTALFV